jgi:hypothetical protein
MARRPAGTGNLFVRMDANGRETYYATWYAAGRKVKRRIGATRVPGTRTGLTKTQAEAELRRLMGEVRASVPRQDRISLELAGQRYIDHLETVKRRKPTTITDYRTILRRHLAPFTAGRTIDAVDAALIRSYVSAKLARASRPRRSATTSSSPMVCSPSPWRAAGRAPTRSTVPTSRRVARTRTSATCAPRSWRRSTAPGPTTTSAQPSARST